MDELDSRSQPTPEASSADLGAAAMGEHVRAVVADLGTVMENITTEEDVDNLAFEVLDQNERAVELRRRIDEARANRTQDVEAIQERREMFEQTRRELALICGVDIDAVEHERQRAEYRKRIGVALKDVGPNTSDEDILTRLGFLKQADESDEEQRIRFTYAQKLFPPYINDLWSRYLEVARRHEAAERRREQAVADDLEEIAQLSLARRGAHNTLADAMGEFLQFPEWDRDRYRNLIEKMLEERFPTLETDELGRMGQDAREFIEEVKILARHGLLARPEDA